MNDVTRLADLFVRRLHCSLKWRAGKGRGAARDRECQCWPMRAGVRALGIRVPLRVARRTTDTAAIDGSKAWTVPWTVPWTPRGAALPHLRIARLAFSRNVSTSFLGSQMSPRRVGALRSFRRRRAAVTSASAASGPAAQRGDGADSPRDEPLG